MRSAASGGILAAALVALSGGSCGLLAAGEASSSLVSVQSGVRPTALGNAFTAVSDDVNALYSNPAGMGFITMFEFTVQHQQAIGNGEQDNFGLVYPLSEITMENVASLGTIGLNAGMLDYGHFEGRDRTGNITGDFDAEDKVLSVAYAKAFGNRFALGVKDKIYELEIDNSQATGSAVDAGLIFRPVPGRLSLALSAFNLGSNVRFVNQSDELAESYVAGLAFVPIPEVLTLLVDVERPKDDDSIYHLGAEWWANTVFALRAGYDSGIETGVGVTMGLGIALRQFELEFFPVDRFMIDYAFVPADDVDHTHRIAISARIGLP